MPAIDQTRTKSAYGLQWNRFRIIRAEEDRATFFNRTGLTTELLEGKLVLDAGCGMGRYLRIAAGEPCGHVIGMDLSRAVEAARELTADLTGVSVVRGDLLRLPFSAESFDVIYSLGVLDPRLIHGRPSSGWRGCSSREAGSSSGSTRERSLVEWIMNGQRAISTRCHCRCSSFCAK